MTVQITSTLQSVMQKYQYMPITQAVIHSMEFEIEKHIMNTTGNMIRVTLEPDPIFKENIILKEVTFREVW